MEDVYASPGFVSSDQAAEELAECSILAPGVDSPAVDTQRDFKHSESPQTRKGGGPWIFGEELPFLPSLGLTDPLGSD